MMALMGFRLSQLLLLMSPMAVHAILLTGDPSCPCLSDIDEVPSFDAKDGDVELWTKLGPAMNSSTYGIGCHAHDKETPQCLESDCATRKNLVPAPLGCDMRWCSRQWCFVDPNNCSLLHKRSPNFAYSDRYYSYATCGDADAFTANKRLESLEGHIFNIGLNSNSGGWLGSYRQDGLHFQRPITKWSGLALDFVWKAAFRGKFMLNMTEPPDYLRVRAKEFFGSTSQFDYCVYAVSLGYLDMCVAQYTITDERATSTDWLLLGSAGIYLVVDTEDTRMSSVELFMKSVWTIFQPFTFKTWMFIIFFVIPVLGCLMIVHESGKGGSTYPSEEAIVITNESTGQSYMKKVPVPFYRTVIKSVYIAFLAVLQSSYEQSVLSIGAMLNLLGISFFILTIIAVYTANLAAILTQNIEEATIDSLEDAIRAGYRLCSERKNMEAIIGIYPNLDPNTFVRDPIELGGDGMPGFTCTQCQSRIRVFDYMDPVLAETDDRYCHAAIAPNEDIEVIHAAGGHCNKSIVGSPIQMTQTGIPIFEEVSPQLISFFLKLKNEGLYDAAYLANKPQSQCPAKVGGEGSALTMTQLSGIWVVSFGFAAAGLLVTFFQSKYKKRQQRKTKMSIQKVHKRDQRGGRIDALGIEDSWMTASSTEHIEYTVDGTSSLGSVRLLQPGKDNSTAGEDNDRSFGDLSWVLGNRSNSWRQLTKRNSKPHSRTNSDISGEQNFYRYGTELTTMGTSDETAVSDDLSVANEARSNLIRVIDQQASMLSEDDESVRDPGEDSIEELLNAMAFVPSSTYTEEDSHV